MEEPRLLPVPSRAANVTDLAQSLPVHIRVPSALLALGRQRHGESEEEAVPDIDQMAISIRQLAQPLHTEPNMFGDLPRPHTSTISAEWRTTDTAPRAGHRRQRHTPNYSANPGPDMSAPPIQHREQVTNGSATQPTTTKTAGRTVVFRLSPTRERGF